MTRRSLAAMAAWTTVLSPAAAWAQPSADAAAADSLFNSAKQLRDAGQYAEACPKFAESERLAPGVGVGLYLGDCYEKTGRPASAWREFRGAEKLARERGDKRADVAAARAQALEPKVNRLTIAVPPTVPQEGLQVLRDGVPVPADEWNQPIPVDPGDHVVGVSTPGQEPRVFHALVDAGTLMATVSIGAAAGATAHGNSFVAATAAADSAPAAGASSSGSARQPGATRQKVGVALVGAGFVGIGLGTAFALASKSTSDPSSAPCDTSNNSGPWPTAAMIAFAAGGVALVSGIALYVTAPQANGVGVVVAPAPMVGGGGALVRARF
jgi:hypothetical protein